MDPLRPHTAIRKTEEQMPSPLKRILLIEDESDIRTVACMALEALGGYTVLPCPSGQAALAVAAEAQADLILLDVMMPGLDGPSTLRELRKIPETAGTPVVFMTAKVQPAEVAQYLALGALDVVAKPFDPMAVAADIQRIWDSRPQ
jgi:CheY-like chemotaxis protein